MRKPKSHKRRSHLDENASTSGEARGPQHPGEPALPEGLAEIGLRGAFCLFALSVGYLFRNNTYLPCGLAFVGAAMIAVGLEIWLRKRRAVKEVLRCGRCGRSLAGLPDSGTCPKCGVGYEIVTETDDGRP